jgi:hypothetical protein
MDIINKMFTLTAEFRSVENKVAQMCLNLKETVFEKPEESNQHLKSLYIWGHIDEKSISKMLIDGGAVVNLMSYVVFKKLGREDDELVKTNLTLNGMREPDGGQRCHLHEDHHREQIACYRVLHRRGAR